MQNFSIRKDHALNNINFFKENSEQEYCESIQKMIEADPFGGHKFYIYSFIKRVDDIEGVKVMYHQPRLTKPEPLPGTTLLRVDPRDPSTVQILWTLPHEESFGLYKYGKMFSDPFVHECIEKYLKSPQELMKREDGDLNDDQIREIYKGMKKSGNFNKEKTHSSEN